MLFSGGVREYAHELVYVTIIDHCKLLKNDRLYSSWLKNYVLQ